MPTLSDLLSDAGADLEIVVKGVYIDRFGLTQTIWLSRSGWSDPVTGPAAQYCPPLVDITVRFSHEVDPLSPGVLDQDVYARIDLVNNFIYGEYAGLFDDWHLNSVDDQPWTIYLVGVLSDGTRVDLEDVESTPLYNLVGIGLPEPGSDSCAIKTRSLHSFSSIIQPVTYSPAALLFPGTLTGIVNLGDSLDITGAQAISVWVYLPDPVSTTQYILFKDSGTTGYYLAVGLVGSGTVAAGVELVVRGQSPATSTTAANVLQAFRWHRIDLSIASTSRRIDIDGITALTTSSITGTPTGNALNLEIGRSLRGKISRLIYWSITKNQSVMASEGRVPIIGNETGLREAFLMTEGEGSTISSIKTGSSLTGMIDSAVLWDQATWHYQAILGKYEPFVLGTVPRVPVVWIDPPKQIGQVSSGPIALFSELQSNHNAVNSANYTVNLASATFTVTTGSLSGTYSATITANNRWNSALLFNGSSSQGTVAVTMPAGAKYLGAHIRVDNISASQRIITAWPGTGNRLSLHMSGSAGTNVLSLVLVNDGGTAFTVSYQLQKGVRYTVLGSVDPANPSTGLKLYIDGMLVATAAISGTFTATQPTLSVGYRAAGPDQFFAGVIDELIVGNTAATLDMAEIYHSGPITSSFPGILIGWHMDEATGATAAPFVGSGNITLTNVSWTAGRSAATDLARVVLYREGYLESGLDFDSWLTALNDNKSDCGWFVDNGARIGQVLDIILGGLGITIYESGGLLKLKRFEGQTGTATETLDPDRDIQGQPIESMGSDDGVYQWRVIYYTNNSRQDAANIAGSLASSDPDRYSYGSSDSLSVTKSDYTVLDRFPGSQPRERLTALLNLRDAEDEASRLLALHRDGADRKRVRAFLPAGGIEIFSELGPLMSELDLDTGTSIVYGAEIEEGIGTILIWRKAVE